MRWVRLTGFSLYVSYLLSVGVGLLLFPWSPGWLRLVCAVPPTLASHIDHPSVQGLVATIGLLHLILVVAESVRVLVPERDAAPTASSRPRP